MTPTQKRLVDLCANLRPPKRGERAEIGAGMIAELIHLGQEALKEERKQN
jgi:hypothetical protein